MTEGPGQQPPQDPRSPEGQREVLEGRVIPSRSQTQRQYDVRPPHQTAQDDPRQQYAAPRQAGPESGTAPQAPGAGPAWSGQQGGVPPQQGHAAGPQGSGPQGSGPQGSGPQQGVQAPAGPQQGPRSQSPKSPSGGFGGQAAAFQQRIQQMRAAAAAEGAGTPPPGPAGPGRPDPSPGTPDWTALADRQSQAAARRRRIMMLTGGIVAVAVVAGGVATAVVVSGKSSDDNSIAGPASSSASGTSQQPLPPAPSFSSVAPPPPANPLDYIGTAAKDKAPLSPDTLFPGKQFLINGRTYVKTASASTTNCASAGRDEVASALAANGCHRLIRATYTNGAMAVTVGVAVFDDTQHAAKLQKTAHYLAPLNGGGVKDFCHAVACQMTSNAVGRYAYFAISGNKNGKTLPGNDTVGKRAANEASNFAFQRIIQRGKDAAAADPNR